MKNKEIISFIDDNKDKYSVQKMCKLLDFPKSSYYYIKSSGESSMHKRREHLKQKIYFIYFKSKKIYGAPKIHQELLKQKDDCSLKLVQRLMQSMDIRSIVLKKYKPISNKPIKQTGENLLNRDFTSEAPGLKIVGDITYVYTKNDGWCYLASFMDLYSKRIVGWSYGKKMDTDLVLNALHKVSKNINISFGKSILHTDLGSQYRSNEYISAAKALGFRLSYSGKGNPYDNACIESFHAIIKKECIYRNCFIDFISSRKVIFEYIESWYNRKRIHSKLNYLSPVEFENRVKYENVCPVY